MAAEGKNLWSRLDGRLTSSATAPTRSRGTRGICIFASDAEVPVVAGRGCRANDAGLQVLVYLPDQKDLFARICGVLSARAGLSILEA